MSVDALEQAWRDAIAMPQLHLESVAEGYRIQAELIKRRDEPVIGLKMGLTSKAKQAQVGVDEVICGRLTASMWVPDGGSVSVSGFIHPRIEPEVAFRLDGGEIVAVAPALEIIDSRYADFRFTAPDVIADNTSAAAFVVGPWSPLLSTVDNLGVLLEVNGAVVQNGSTAAILGDPRRAFLEGVALARRYGLELGEVFLAGAATAAVPLEAGAFVRATVQGIGSVSVKATA